MNKKIKFLLVIVVILTAAVFMAVKMKQKAGPAELTKEIKPVSGSIQSIISTTGTILPKNRLEIKPPVNGRIESILVKEGQDVKSGQTLAWMSSTERAALLDAARSESEEKLKYWQEVYKPIALMAPIDGEVIVATTQPGQTVTASDSVIVLSDYLIVRAQVDETDIGKIKVGQSAYVSLDAYPQTRIKADVGHIYYESKTVNNVTIYEVDLIPQEESQFFRSGMNATVDFIEKSKDKVLMLPLEAVHREKDEAFVLLKENSAKEPVRRDVKLGISNDKNAEILSGLTASDTVIVKSTKYTLPKSSTGTNPFMPSRRRATPGR